MILRYAANSPKTKIIFQLKRAFSTAIKLSFKPSALVLTKTKKTNNQKNETISRDVNTPFLFSSKKFSKKNHPEGWLKMLEMEFSGLPALLRGRLFAKIDI